MSYQLQNVGERRDFYRFLHQAANGAKHLIVVSADHSDFLPTLGLIEVLSSFEACPGTSRKGL